MLDLRKPQPVAQPAAQPVAAPAPRPLLPIGTVLSLSPEEQASLESLGWKQGEPVPDVASAVEQVRREAAASPHYDQAQPVTPLRTVNIEDLPEAERQRLMDGIRHTIEAAKNIKVSSVANPQDYDPSVLAAMSALDASAQAPVAVTLTPKPKTADKPDIPSPGMATMAPVKHVCSHCGWEEGNAAPDVADQDKTNFLAMIVGGSRFVKEYELFGGQMSVFLRNLTTAEMNLAITQAAYDDRDGEIPASYEFFRRVTNYQTVMALCAIRRGQNRVELPTIDQVTAETVGENGKPQTKLKAYYPHIVGTYLEQDAVFRVVCKLYGDFKALQTRMEANMLNVDFYAGIASPV
jgi:hypothetical protein